MPSEEIVIKPKSKILAVNKMALITVWPFIILIAIYASSKSVSYWLSAIAAGFLIGIFIVLWLRLTHTIAMGPDYVKVRNGWRVHSYHSGAGLVALRVRETSTNQSLLFLHQNSHKSMINTLDDEQIDHIVERLNVIPEEAQGLNGVFDRKTISEAGRNALPFWVRHPSILGGIIGTVIVILVIVGSILYVTMQQQ